ncbi:MAG TPA: macrolide ABC transporter permease/ATP-binding protein MacB [Nitrospiraceae bacterium]|nr:MAG: macrolide ABC transporter permease/ATP-binding protein MacB [Nitrospirae bacterium GWA2_46_11]HAK88314.1 macrolide ABC transporter permease/ATP-binding protein MacB [Nitrospiraceae bacterium]
MAEPVTTPLIELRHITKVFRSGDADVEILKNISLSIQSGEFVAIMGPSGSGKSTLMNLIGCLDRPTTGTYLMNGEDVSHLSPDGLAALRRHTFGFIFQRYNLISGLTAAENVEVPAVYAGMPRKERSDRAEELLTSLGLNDRLGHRPSQLSGGQQQRVSVARSLMNGGTIILADEPTGALDSKSGAEVMDILHRLHEKGHTIIIVTHDLSIAGHAGRVIRIADGEIISNEKTEKATKKEAIDSGSRGLSQFTDKAKRSRRMGLSPDSDIAEAFKMALHSLHINKFRTFLTMLGIVIGVGSVVAMLAIGNGAKQEVLARIQAMGTNLLLVKPGAPGVRGAGGTIATLVPEDADAVKTLYSIAAVVPEMIQPVTLRYRNKDFATTANATVADFTNARNWPNAAGIFFSDEDVKRYAQVTILGQTVVDNLFQNGENPLGKYILMGNVPFQVIGVMSAKGADAGGNDMDNMVWIPLTTGSARLFGQRHLRSISVQAVDATAMDSAQMEIKKLLIKRHGKEDFQVKSMAALIETATRTQDTLTYLLGAIAAISLIVGGIGVMNIMLVSVTERIREIGIRMAVGARTFDVLLQFLTEAVVVSLIGGVIGIFAGIAGGLFASKAMGWLAIFSAEPIMLAFLCSFITGLIFGYLPARKAASLDPVTALAAE